MPIFDRRNRQELDQLVEEYITTSNINRRQFLQRATAAGLSLGAASSLLAACGGSSGGSSNVTSIDVLTVWSANELKNFNLIDSAFKAKTGITISVESTRDISTVLTTRLRGNHPPDVSGMPSLSQFQTFAKQGKLVALDKFFDMTQVQRDYSQGWINLASYNSHLYAVLPKANSKG